MVKTRGLTIPTKETFPHWYRWWAFSASTHHFIDRPCA